MKKQRKFMSILFLFLIVGNLVVTNTSFIVNATGSNKVEDTIVLNNNNITYLKNKIETLKLDSLYEEDNSFKETLDFMEKEVLDLEKKLNNKKNILEEGILLSDLIKTSFIDKKDIYDTYFTDDELITITTIKDVTYLEFNEELNDYEEKTLLTKEEIENALYNNYLLEIENEIKSYLDNFDTRKTNLINLYNEVIELKEQKVLDLTNELKEIENFYEEEILLNNVPNMIVNSLDIRDLIESDIDKLEEIVSYFTIDEITDKKENINLIYGKTMDNINTFYLNNKNYIENGLKEKIESFDETLTNINVSLSTKVNLDDYKNEEIDKFIDLVDSELIEVLDSIIKEEENYDNLIKDINLYLERKPSDKEEIEKLLTNINALRVYINKEKALVITNLIIENSDLEDEDVVDVLLEFIDFPIEEDQKNKLEEAKLSFYNLTLKDNTNYDMSLVLDNLILEDIKETLLKQDFIDNLDYGDYIFEVLDSDNITNDGKVIIYDRDDKLLKEYNIVIKGDINNDNIFDEKDVSLLNEKLLKEKLTDYVRLDYNGDKLIDIYDLVLMKNRLEEQKDIEETKESTFELSEISKDNKTCYNITLKTDGVVSGFGFDLSVSDNLNFDSIINNELNININENKVIGLGNFKDGDSFTLCFVEDLSISNTKVFSLSNIKFIYDNLNTKEIDNLQLVTVKVVEEVKKENKVTYLNNYKEEQKTEEVKQEENINKEENKEEVKQETKDEKELAITNVIKIIIIVLLGAVIVYFLNKKDNDEEEKDFLSDDKEEKSK